MAEALIIDACRTPRGIGKSGKGALAEIHPQQLAATVLKAIAERSRLDTADVDDIIWGTSTQRGKQSGDLGRMAALDAGYDVKASGVTLDRFCGSGITSVNLAAAMIMSGMEDVVIAGGTEMMSYTGSLANAAEPFMLDAGNLRLRASHPPIASGGVRRCHRHARRHHARRPPRCTDKRARISLGGPANAPAAPTSRSPKAASTEASFRSILTTVALHSIVRNFPVRRRRRKASPHSSHPSRRLRITRWTKRAPPMAGSFRTCIPILRSSMSITPAIPRASSTAPPRSC